MFTLRTRSWFSVITALALVALTASPCEAQRSSLDQQLLRAVQRDKADEVAELIKQGANPNAAGIGRRSLLCEAVGNLKVVQVLLAAGAKPDESAMRQAGWLNKTEAAKQMLEAGGSPDPCLLGAAQGGHVALVRLLLDKGANPNAKSKEGSTPLHGAALQGGLETVQMLLAAGADPNATDDQGESPLHPAISGDAELATVKALVEAGAKLTITNQEGMTPVRLAATRGEKRIYEWLLEAGGGKEPLPSSDPKSPAGEKSTAELVKLLQTRDREAQSEALRELASRGNEIMPEVLKSIEAGTPIESFLSLFMAMGPEAEAALPKLKELLGDKKSVLGVAMTLERMKPGGFRELPAETRKVAAETLYQAASDEGFGERAAWHLFVLTTLEEEAVPYLLKMLRSGDARQQRSATECLRESKIASPEIQAALMKLARQGSDAEGRRDAIEVLGRYGKADDKLKQQLLDVLRNPPPFEERRDDGELTEYDAWKQRADSAGRSLSRFGPEVIDDLLPLLTPINAPYRVPAIEALRGMGAPAVPRLIELLGHEDDAVAISAAIAVRNKGRPAIEALTKALGSENEKVTVRAAHVLEDFGRHAKSALPALLGIAESEKQSDAERLAAARAAIKIDAESRSFKPVLSTIPALMRLLDKGTFKQQGDAAETLGLIGPAAHEALPLLRKRMELPDDGADTQGLVKDYVRRQASHAIAAIEKDPPDEKQK